jgi:hypothetical protein
VIPFSGVVFHRFGGSCYFHRDRDNSVNIVTRQRAGRPGFGSRRGRNLFCSLPRQNRLRDPPSLLSSGYRRAISPRINQPRRESDHSLPSSTDVKNAWSYTSTLKSLWRGAWLRTETSYVLTLPCCLHLWGSKESRIK